MAPDKVSAQAGRGPAQHNPYLLAWLSSSTSCSGLLGLLCGSGVLGDAGCWEGAAGSPWPPLRAVGFSGQVSPTLAATFFSSEPAKVLRKNKYLYGASALGPVLLYPMLVDGTSCGHSGLFFQDGEEKSPVWPPPHRQSVSSLERPQHYFSPCH